MRPGPKPKPTAIRVFEGNPGNIPLNEHEPKPDEASVDDAFEDWMEPDCEYMIAEKFPLSDVSKLAWNELYPQLVTLGVITAVDRGKFARYCDTLARWLKSKAFIDKHGETYPIYGTMYEQKPSLKSDGTPELDFHGKPVVKTACVKVLKQMRQFPQVGIYIKLGDALRRYEEEFGIGAASRTRIQAIVQNPLAQKDDDEFDYAKQRRLRAVKK